MLYAPPRVITQQGVLANGTFGIWQQGLGPFTASGVRTADGWLTTLQGTSTITISAETTIVYAPASSRSLKAIYVQGSQNSLLSQKLHDWSQCRSKYVTFRCYVNCSVASAVRIAVYDGVTRWFSPYHSGGGAWEQLYVASDLVSNSNTTLVCELWMEKSGTYYFDSADTFVSTQGAIPVATEFWESDPLYERERIYRFIQAIDVDVSFNAVANNQTHECLLVLPTQLFGGTPTISTLTAGTHTNVNTITYANTTNGQQNGVTLSLISDLPGDVIVSGETILLESYP